MIHPQAIVDPAARIGTGVTIGPFSVIGADVEIGDDCWIGPHVVINGPTRIGRENRIFQFASVGEAPQDKKFAGEASRLEVGDRNVIREYATLHRGTATGIDETRVGSDNLIMAYCHVAHDCIVGNHVIMSNAASLAGHVEVGDHVILGGFSMVHQFVRVGDHAFSGMGSHIARDVPPFVICSGHPAHPHGINAEGLKRRGFTPERLRAIRRHYKLLYKSGLRLADALEQLAMRAADDADAALMAEFIRGSQRSILR